MQLAHLVIYEPLQTNHLMHMMAIIDAERAGKGLFMATETDHLEVFIEMDGACGICKFIIHNLYK